MPTPFYHLSLADGLLRLPGLPNAMNQFLREYQGEFLFGCTAPDVQVVSGQPRESTHFFTLPIRQSDRVAWEKMLLVNPQLAEGGELGKPQAAFLAGYLCHLQADWIWVKDIFAPNFGPFCVWGSFKKRLYFHNVLRAYLDLNILPKLPNGIDKRLSQVHPAGWLPFASNSSLAEWRDFIAPQLRWGEPVHTVEVFSSRQGISAPEFSALLESKEQMQREIFSRVSLDRVKQYDQTVLEENRHLLYNYLAFTLHPTPKTAEGRVFRRALP
jgi:hypothetical protein